MDWGTSTAVAAAVSAVVFAGYRVLVEPTHAVVARVSADPERPPEPASLVMARLEADLRSRGVDEVEAHRRAEDVTIRLAGRDPKALTTAATAALRRLQRRHDLIRRTREKALRRQRDELGPPAEMLALRLAKVVVGRRTKTEVDPPVPIPWWPFALVGAAVGVVLGLLLGVARRGFVLAAVTLVGVAIGAASWPAAPERTLTLVRPAAFVVDPPDSTTADRLAERLGVITVGKGTFAVAGDVATATNAMAEATTDRLRAARATKAARVRALKAIAGSETKTEARFEALRERAQLELVLQDASTATVAVLPPPYVLRSGNGRKRGAVVGGICGLLVALVVVLRRRS